MVPTILQSLFPVLGDVVILISLMLESLVLEIVEDLDHLIGHLPELLKPYLHSLSVGRFFLGFNDHVEDVMLFLHTLHHVVFVQNKAGKLVDAM